MADVQTLPPPQYPSLTSRRQEVEYVVLAEADGTAHIGHHDHLFADQVLRAIRLPDTGKNGALLAADIYPQAQQLIGTFYRFGVHVQYCGHSFSAALSRTCRCRYVLCVVPIRPSLCSPPCR